MKNLNQRKTILIFSANYLPNIGGVEKFTESLSRELESNNIHTIIVTNNVFCLSDHEILPSGSEIYRLPCFSLLQGRLPLPRKNKNFNQLFAAIKQRHIDYILINTRFYPHSLLGAQLARQKNIVPIIIDHGSDYLTLGNPVIDQFIKAYEHLITAALKKYPGVYYGISQASINWLKTFKIESSGVISNSIDADAYLNQASDRDYRNELNLTKSDFLVCFTGRLIPEKGIIPLLDSAQYLSHVDPSIHFLFAGDGPLRKVMEEKDLPNTHLLGQIDVSDIAALLSQSDVFCLPSRSEGFSTSLLEASACYTPSIVTNVGGVLELIPSPDYGIVLENSSASNIATAIQKFQNNKSANLQIGENAGRLVRQRFSWRETAQKVLTACQKANHR